jgi:hypothetical protein
VGDEFVLEIPKLHTSRYNLPLTIPAGKTLLAVIPLESMAQETPRGKAKERTPPDTLCLAITCYVITPEVISEP